MVNALLPRHIDVQSYWISKLDGPLCLVASRCPCGLNLHGDRLFPSAIHQSAFGGGGGGGDQGDTSNMFPELVRTMWAQNDGSEWYRSFHYWHITVRYITPPPPPHGYWRVNIACISEKISLELVYVVWDMEGVGGTDSGGVETGLWYVEGKISYKTLLFNVYFVVICR